MSSAQGGLGGLQPLSPEQFRAQFVAKRAMDDHAASDESAYEEFLNNCRALSLKANTALLQQSDNIRHGEVVDLQRTYVGGAGLQAMCTLLAQNTALRKLIMPQNGLYNDAVVYFCRSMKFHPTLERVDFSGNPQISLAGGLALLSLINDNRPLLTVVNVADTRIPDAVRHKIERALAANQEALMLLSSDGSRNVSPLPPGFISADMAKTMGALYVPPTANAAATKASANKKNQSNASAAAAAGRDQPAAHGLYHTYTAGSDGADQQAVFVAEKSSGSRYGTSSRHTGDATMTSTTWTASPSTTATTAGSGLSGARVGRGHSHVNQSSGSQSPTDGPLNTVPTVTDKTKTNVVVVAPRTREEREAARASAWATKETKSLKRLKAQLQQYADLLRDNNATNTLPPADPTTRWRVLEVAILAPPAIFESEIDVLVNDVFPTLNRELQSRRVTLQPLVTPSSPGVHANTGGVTATTASAMVTESGAAGQALKSLQCTAAVDVLHDVQRSRLALIELIGDRPGELRQPTEADMEAGETEMVPVLYAAHQEAIACSQCIIAAIRRSASCMNIPPALAPLFSCEPRIEHPDKHRPVEKEVHMDSDVALDTAPTAATTTVTGASSAAKRTVILDHQREMRLWERHEAFKTHVRQSLSASPEMMVDGYKATFHGTDSTGAVRVTDLDEFRNAVYHRLLLLLTTLFPPVTTESLLSVADLGVTDPQILRGAGRGAAHTTAASTVATAPTPDVRVLPERDVFTGPAAHQRHLVQRAYQSVFDRLFAHIVDASPRTLPRKGIQNRLHLYLTTPPSRNLFLLHHAYESTSLTSTVAITATKQLFAKPFAYCVASHSTRVGALSEEPTDVREVMTHILSQLTTDPDVLHYLRCEVDIHRLKRFFINFLSGSQLRPTESQPAMVALNALGPGAATTASTTTTMTTGTDAQVAAPAAVATQTPMPDVTAKTLQQRAKEATADEASSEDANKVFVVLLDGLDEVVPIVEPCLALRRSPETGADEWAAVTGGVAGNAAADPDDDAAAALARGGGGATSGKAKQAQIAAEETRRLSFLPTCLSRNVRLIVTATTDAAPLLLKVLTARGRDSVDAFAVPNTTVNETEMLLSPSALDPFDTYLSDDGLIIARDKTDSQKPEFLHYLTDALRMHFEAPGSQTMMELLTAFPDTVDGAARRVHQQLVARFGAALVKNALGLLCVSRWGVVECDLRALLQLPPKRFNEFLRLLRPALESMEWFGVPPIPTTTSAATRAGNGQAAYGGGGGGDESAPLSPTSPTASTGSNSADDERSDMPVQRSESDVLAPPVQTRLDPNCSGNVLQRRIRIASPAFLRLLRQEELRADEEGTASAAERRTWHQTLAQHFYATVQRSLSQERHQLLLSTEPLSGPERHAVKEFVYHVTLGGLWALLDRVALSFPFMMLVYRHQLGYAYLRDLVFAFNVRHEEFLLGQEVTTGAATAFRPVDAQDDGLRDPFTDLGDTLTSTTTAAAGATQGNNNNTNTIKGAGTTTTLPTALMRMRSYIFFVRQYSALLAEHPHLVLQAALERSPGLTPAAELAATTTAGGSGQGGSSTLRMVMFEAADFVRRYFYWQPTNVSAATTMTSGSSTSAAAAIAAANSDAQVRVQNRKRVFFRIANERKSRVHLGPVTSCAFSPNGRHVVSGSTDRSVAWVQPSSGSLLYQGRQSSARLRQVIFADTSAYVLAVAEDRTLYVYDTALGKLVSRNDAALFDAPISAVTFSSRGRYYIVALEDFNVHVFTTERSQLIGSVPAASWQVSQRSSPSSSTTHLGSATPEKPPVFTQRRAHVHILHDPAEEKRFHIFANELYQTWSVNALGDGVESVVSAKRTSLNVPLASVQWYPLGGVERKRARLEQERLRDGVVAHMEEARQDLAVAGRYAVLLPAHRGFVSLYDMERQCETARAHPASLAGQCWAAAAATDASIAAAAPSSPTSSSPPTTVAAFTVGRDTSRWLAVGGSDGSVALYDMVRCVSEMRVARQLAVATVNTLRAIDAPVHTCLSAYRASAEAPRIIGLSFALDDTALLAVSDTNRVLYWDVANLVANNTAVRGGGSSSSNGDDDVVSRDAAPLLDVGAAGHRPTPYDGADGEFLLSSVTRAQVVSWAVRPTPSQQASLSAATTAATASTAEKKTASLPGEEGASLVALGDSEGRIVLLDLWRPTA